MAAGVRGGGRKRACRRSRVVGGVEADEAGETIEATDSVAGVTIV